MASRLNRSLILSVLVFGFDERVAVFKENASDDNWMKLETSMFALQAAQDTKEEFLSEMLEKLPVLKWEDRLFQHLKHQLQANPPMDNEEDMDNEEKERVCVRGGAYGPSF